VIITKGQDASSDLMACAPLEPITQRFIDDLMAAGGPPASIGRLRGNFAAEDDYSRGRGPERSRQHL
jgi:hypothetical protein